MRRASTMIGAAVIGALVLGVGTAEAQGRRRRREQEEAAERARQEAEAQAAARAAAEAQAAQSAGDEEARARFESGRAAFTAGRYEDALHDFQRAYELSDRPALLYNIGTTADRLRRPEDALRAFEQYLEAVPDAPNRAEVESRIQHLRDDVATREAERRAAEEAAARAAQPSASGDATLQIAGLATIGAGVAVAIVGAIFGGIALDANGTLERDRATLDADRQGALVSQIDRDAAIADVLIGVGGVAAIAGVVITVIGFSSGGGSAAPETAPATSAWSVEPGLGSVRVRARF